MSRRQWPWWTPISSARFRSAAIVCLFVLGVLRFIAIIVWAVQHSYGDFAATLPGPYAEQWNVRLWDSPDLEAGVAFHRHSYGYGPTQYLTLWPIVFLDSYHQIAAALLPVYVAAIVGVAYLLWRVCDTLAEGEGRVRERQMAVYAAVFLFGPLMVALGQREFEVMQALLLVLVANFLVRDRPAAAGAALGYVSLFKYWPLGLAAYLVLRRQWRAVAAFAAAVAVVLIVAHAVFDLGRFPFAFTKGFDRQFARIYEPLGENAGFCAPVTATAASVQNGVCAALGGRSGAARVIFYGGLGAATAAFLIVFALLERAAPLTDQRDHRWRAVLEYCFFLIAAGVVFHAHYYYLSILILPLTVLLDRQLWRAGGGAGHRLALTMAAYFVLSAFLVPPGVLARLAGHDGWAFYLSHGIYMYGYALLIGLLFWEYGMLLKRERHSPTPAQVSR